MAPNHPFWIRVLLRVASGRASDAELGATARDVRRLILAQTLRPVAVGLAIGIAIAAGVARVLQSVLFGVSPFDPVAYLGAPLVMTAIAVLATWLPTRQSLRADPVAALRCE